MDPKSVYRIAIQSLTTYIIRHDVTGRVWEASASEARLYAIGGHFEASAIGPNPYSVFVKNGDGCCLTKEQVK